MQIGESYFYKGLDDEDILILNDPLDTRISQEIKNYNGLRIVVRKYVPWEEFDSSTIEEKVSEIRLEDPDAPNQLALKFRYIESLHLPNEPEEGYFSRFQKLSKCTIGGARKLPKDLAELKSLRSLQLLDDCSLRQVGQVELFESFVGLEELYLSAKSLPRGLCRLEGLPNLRSLSLSDWKGDGLRLIEGLKSLEMIRLDYANKVSGLDDFAVCEKLTSVHLAAMKSLRNLTGLASLKKLTSLTLEDCAGIESLSPLFAHQRLRDIRLWGKTKIEDGDIRGLLTCPNLKAVEYNNRRGYNLKFEEVEQELARLK
ncbi:MAG: hypothetical protein AAF065_03060 [Verrucomicrobiota bacterium]